MDQADDLKAFERRMIEIISSLQPSIWRWRFLLLILILITLITFFYLITDVSFSLLPTSLSSIHDNKSYLAIFLSYLFRKEIYFSLSVGLLICAVLSGIHRKMFSSAIIIERFCYVLADYNMSCDSDGRLIIKPRTIVHTNGGS